MDLSLANVPSFEGKRVVICPDTSGSMGSPVIDQSQRGRIRDVSIIPRCIDVAGIVSAAFLRNNPDSLVLPFATQLHRINLNPRDTLTTNTNKLRQLGGGGTNCSAPLSWLNAGNKQADLVIYISDYESWIDSSGRNRYGGTAMMDEWTKFHRRNKGAKLICIDCTPSRTIQAPDKKHNLINIGGFSDHVFEMARMFVNDEFSPNHWTGFIRDIEL